MNSSDTKLSDFIVQVLKRRFPSISAKHEINDGDAEKLNFACPYCGDSDRDHSKKRGNIYLKTDTFKCFNDGCLKWVPLDRFVSNFALKYSLEIPSINKSKEIKTVDSRVTRRGFLIEYLMNPKVKSGLLDFNKIISRFFLLPCKDADPDSPIWKYVSSRNLNLLPTFDLTCYYDSRMDKIYIFNLDIRSGKVLGLSIRRIDDSYSGPKYSIRNYSEFKKSRLVGNLEDDVIDKIDAINNYFNILNINFSKPIIVLEGQFDAMFLDNALATTGVTKSKTILGTLVTPKTGLILFDNDNAGKTESIKLLNQGYRVFLWNKIISELRKSYPNLRKEINKIKDINNLFNFYKEIDPDLDYDSFNSKIKDNFSNSPYDLLMV
jgi:hypothetical protein